MIPSNDEYFEDSTDDNDFDEEVETSKTYRLDSANDIVLGKCDDVEAIEQAVYKILHTERYSYEIYPWDYGIELQDLYGKDIDYVIAELPYRIKDALEVDDRIDHVDDFELEQSGKRCIQCMFTVYTVNGYELSTDYKYSEGGE